MDFHDYLDVLRRRWRFVTVCVLLGLAAAVAATALMPRTYTATAQLFIATSGQSSGDAYEGGLFTQQRVKSYTRVVTSPSVLQGVISALDLKTTPGRLAEKISAQAPLDTTLVDIQVTDPSPTRAQAIADETAQQFTRYIATIEGSSAGVPPLVKASVVGGSQPPTDPTSPRPELNVAIGLLGGAIVGVAGAVLRHTLDRTLRSPGDIRSRLGLTTLGTLPPPEGRRRGAPPTGTTRRAEALSQLSTRLRFASDAGLPRSLLIASALPGEGRTRTALDVATSVARTGGRVVLVEADLRRPRLGAELDLAPSPGLTGVLTGTAAPHSALVQWRPGHLRVLPAGPAHPDPYPLLSGRRLTEVLRTLEADADLVVVDSPPLLPFADGAAVGSVAHGVLFVVRADRTPREEALRALDTLAAVHAEVLGAVLTGAADKQLTDWRPPDGPAPTPMSPPPPQQTVVPRVPARHHG
ncbi:Wzz/FepE/Etk N-terminal domain-containing protein [Streptomyces sp. enrichment culture]|uniref:Wzz/FepE/Etk N-terminal domain-containing protein n=1 Tax=Streptomyces sp. enrichment culture TaxID=1795815 RepID=UPI003F54BB6B